MKMTGHLSTESKRFKYNPTAAMVVAMVAGVVTGLIVGPTMQNIQFIGNIFFRLIQMGIVPFVMCEIIGAIGSLTKKELAGIGSRATVAFLVSSLLASAFGIDRKSVV